VLDASRLHRAGHLLRAIPYSTYYISTEAASVPQALASAAG